MRRATSQPVCDRIKEACQTHTGITDGTFYRDQGWYFYQLGPLHRVRRPDHPPARHQIPLLLPQAADPGSPIDVSQWMALLRSAAGYHAFRRLHPGGIDAGAGGRLPAVQPDASRARSISACARSSRLLGELKSRYALRSGNEAAEALDGLRAMLDSAAIAEILQRRAARVSSTSVQRSLIALSRHLSPCLLRRATPQTRRHRRRLHTQTAVGTGNGPMLSPSGTSPPTATGSRSRSASTA